MNKNIVRIIAVFMLLLPWLYISTLYKEVLSIAFALILLLSTVDISKKKKQQQDTNSDSDQDNSQDNSVNNKRQNISTL